MFEKWRWHCVQYDFTPFPPQSLGFVRPYYHHAPHVLMPETRTFTPAPGVRIRLRTSMLLVQKSGGNVASLPISNHVTKITHNKGPQEKSGNRLPHYVLKCRAGLKGLWKRVKEGVDLRSEGRIKGGGGGVETDLRTEEQFKECWRLDLRSEC